MLLLPVARLLPTGPTLPGTRLPLPLSLSPSDELLPAANAMGRVSLANVA